MTPSTPFGVDDQGRALTEAPLSLQQLRSAIETSANEVVGGPDEYDVAKFLERIFTEETELIDELIKDKKLDEDKFKALLNRFKKNQ